MKNSDWEVGEIVRWVEEDGEYFYEGGPQEEVGSQNNNQQNQKSRSLSFLNQCGSVMVRRGHSFSTKKDSNARDRLAENKKE